MRIYGDKRSGNCYKIQLLLALTGQTCKWTHMDILRGDTRSPTFLEKAPAGKIPVLELDDGRILTESNAILNFLAAGTALVPTTPFEHAKMLEWQFFEQYSHEPNIAVARFIKLYLGLPAARREEYEAKHAAGYRALEVMEQQLSRTPYLLGEQFSLADISLFAYTHVADEGGFDLAPFPAIRYWLELITTQPGFVSMG
ncbi:glutathione S-transferase family protein [Alteromonas sp. ASW11-19]|uniref:Glutathione S-transferase family protein n=1 Tax=Alteromonas salexigens TaxID=2982530 RepID=A0ABT2VK05_9ALTE|nr:glutathione S-transferase family protein [Alteromonas salexigens]MCU7553593.1 glutathione S-transferase family protein [Alteromonas salexigens]